jgi:hypothetical protein
MKTINFETLDVPQGASLILSDEIIRPNDWVLWSRKPRNAWTRIVKDSPFVGSTSEREGCFFARDVAPDALAKFYGKNSN